MAIGNVDPSRLLMAPAWGAVIPALPTIALAFVFQMIVPVVVIRLGNDPEKVGRINTQLITFQIIQSEWQ